MFFKTIAKVPWSCVQSVEPQPPGSPNSGSFLNPFLNPLPLLSDLGGRDWYSHVRISHGLWGGAAGQGHSSPFSTTISPLTLNQEDLAKPGRNQGMGVPFIGPGTHLSCPLRQPSQLS